MSTYYRYDSWCTDALGNAIAGASVAFCSQPANTSTQPPSPLIQLYADPNGVTPIANPLTTDGYGHAFAYMAEGVYTVVTYSPRIETVILEDQVVTSPTSAPTTWNSDSSTAGTITGAINGTNPAFTLSGAPAPSTSLVFTVNGLVSTVVSVSGNVVNLATAPHTGSQLAAVYQITT